VDLPIVPTILGDGERGTICTGILENLKSQRRSEEHSTSSNLDKNPKGDGGCYPTWEPGEGLGNVLHVGST